MFIYSCFATILEFASTIITMTKKYSVKKVLHGSRLCTPITVVMTLFGSLFSCNKDNDFIPHNSTVCIENVPLLMVYSEANEYAAFCDLAILQTNYFAAFRVGHNHVPEKPNENGEIQILYSTDGLEWVKERRIRHKQYDLRDPCFCIKADGNLLLYYGFYDSVDNNLEYRTGYTEFQLIDGKLDEVKSGNVQIGNKSNLWLWKTYNRAGKYYGVIYYDKGIYPTFVESTDGYNFSIISEIQVDGNETSLAFDGDRVYAFVRNVAKKGCYVCFAEPPYNKWEIVQQDIVLACPESFMIENDIFVAGRTAYGMSLYRLNKSSYKLEPAYNYFALGSYSDSGYPGCFLKDNYLWTVFYGCTPEATNPSIFISKLHISAIRNGSYME